MDLIQKIDFWLAVLFWLNSTVDSSSIRPPIPLQSDHGSLLFGKLGDTCTLSDSTVGVSISCRLEICYSITFLELT